MAPRVGITTLRALSRKPASLEARLEVFLLERPKGVVWAPGPGGLFALFRIRFWEPRLLRKPYFLQGKTNILGTILGAKMVHIGGPFFPNRSLLLRVLMAVKEGVPRMQAKQWAGRVVARSRRRVCPWDFLKFSKIRENGQF